jgi:hypothetical protein
MSWLHYLLEANIYLSVFYLLYFILLNKETHYKLNRVYLLVSCVVAYIIPVIQIGSLKPYSDDSLRQVVTIVANPNFKTLAVAASRHFSMQDYLLIAYITGAVIMLTVLVLKFIQLYKLTNAQNSLLDNKYKLIKLENSNTAFSFFNYVFIGTKVSGTDTIIRHELVHINQKHSLDIVFLELIKIINWFNPFIYLLQRSLKTIHEYIADEQTAAFENDALTYSSFLVNNAYGISGTSITHSFFNYNLLKKRIIMLNQKRSGNLARLKYLIVIPVCAGLLCMSTLSFSKNYGWLNIMPAKKAATVKTINNNDHKPGTITLTGFTIHPNNYNTAILEKMSADFRKKGYRMDFEELADNLGPLLKITINPINKPGWSSTSSASATFRIYEMKRSGYIIFVGADESKKMLFVHSMLDNPVAQADTSKKIPPPPPPMPPKNVNTNSKPVAVVQSSDTATVKLLKQLPGVKVNNNGEVTVQGKPITKVRINGKDLESKDIQPTTKTLSADTKPALANVVVKGYASKKTADVTIDELQKMPPPPPPKDPFDTLYKYIAKYVRYPASARDKHIAGRTIFMFDIENGKITNVKSVRDLDPTIDAEVARVLNHFTGTLPVKSGSYSIPVSLSLINAAGKQVGNSPDFHAAKKGAENGNTFGAVPQRTNYMLNEVVVTSYVN